MVWVNHSRQLRTHIKSLQDQIGGVIWKWEIRRQVRSEERILKEKRSKEKGVVTVNGSRLCLEDKIYLDQDW